MIGSVPSVVVLTVTFAPTPPRLPMSCTIICSILPALSLTRPLLKGSNVTVQANPAPVPAVVVERVTVTSSTNERYSRAASISASVALAGMSYVFSVTQPRGRSSGFLPSADCWPTRVAEVPSTSRFTCLELAESGYHDKASLKKPLGSLPGVTSRTVAYGLVPLRASLLATRLGTLPSTSAPLNVMRHRCPPLRVVPFAVTVTSSMAESNSSAFSTSVVVDAVPDRAPVSSPWKVSVKSPERREEVEVASDATETLLLVELQLSRLGRVPA
mmetsp:Transcript_97158/g.278072  ORF Transcript_97158/g.278072 Transcript_97158/m.278072 type:complete len:272 (+) Transcript_97158:544-1359(+)